ncbi:uncharacterized protein TRAVEDRAFT_71869 [Trametes versicolor FP-101664 SS1]|uniref:uncharacterized protein n=1 Tax=Trametes versicolor (strain FP-101664) TaxID=717944 RepID=UPI0004621B15|nr:uncharacterized protein TRAVEDRAFT_71869 [Trametes versicolor FP-101664 SS1]EIW58175.1 hypothetical protein TRAVEDRAFT_71869 [Trametes versicolor FP-101664 SS1]
MATQQPSAAILSAGSTATLDLLDLLSSGPSESLLSTGLDFLPAVESSHSFDNVPPFPTTAKPLIFFPDLGTSLLYSTPPATFADDATPALTTLPTGPRLKVMMMEILSVEAWNESIVPKSDYPREVDMDAADLDASKPSLWIPEGSLFSPQNFSALFRKGLSRVVEEPSSPLDDRDFDADLTLVEPNVSAMSSFASLSDTLSRHVNAPRLQPVPTILVSSSTAALPLSLGSSPDLQHELPLAVRRGKKVPPALSLGQSKKAQPTDCNEDAYPDIPTPFLGSPTSSTPITEQPREPSNFTMGLSAMCADLRSRLPLPPPFSPTEPTPPRTYKADSPSSSIFPSQDSVVSDLDDEEWAFARDLVADWHGMKKLRVEVSPPPSPAVELPYTSDSASPTAETSFDATPPSLESGSDSSSDDEDPVQTPSSVKQTRRKTVIIQTPDLVRPEQTEKVLSIASAPDGGCDILTHSMNEPVPFETPILGHLSSELLISTPPGSRPSSTASCKPVRGILKEKKSVRFSTVDMFHEYTPSVQPALHHVADGVTVAPQHHAPTTLQAEAAMPSRRLTLTSAVHRNSPLRESYAPTSLASARNPDPRARAHSPAVRQLQDPALWRTTAKHPAVRALARAPSAASSPTPTLARPAGSGRGGAVLGAPSLQSPTPTLLEAQRRAPLRTTNARQPAAAARRSEPLSPVKLSPVKPTRASVLPAARGGVPAAFARRVLRTTSIPPRARNEVDENARRRSQPAAGREASCGAVASAGAGMGGKSRMSAPLRSIFTKLRA